MTDKEIRAEVKELYNSIELCIGDLVKGRFEHNETQVANAHHKMESLLVQTQQVLSCVNDSFKEPASDDLDAITREYSLNISSKLYNILPPEMQVLWKKETEQHFLNGIKRGQELLMKNGVHATVDYPFIGYDFPNIYPNYRELKDYCDKNDIKDNAKVKLIMREG